MTDNTNIWLNGIMGVVVGDLIYISPSMRGISPSIRSLRRDTILSGNGCGSKTHTFLQFHIPQGNK